MSIHDHPVPGGRGGAPVGLLADLPPVERGAVLYLRQWCEGPEQRDAIRGDFRLALGQDAGSDLGDRFDALMHITLGSARRPLLRHAVGCACVGGDESAFAQMVAGAAPGDLDDAVLFAMTLMSGPAAAMAVPEAEAAGLGFGLMFGRPARLPGTGPLAAVTLHRRH